MFTTKDLAIINYFKKIMMQNVQTKLQSLNYKVLKCYCYNKKNNSKIVLLVVR